MSIFKTSVLLVVGLTFAGATPAFAHKDGIDWISMMQRMRAANSYAQERTAPKVAPRIETKQPTWRYLGGPKGTAVYGR